MNQVTVRHAIGADAESTESLIHRWIRTDRQRERVETIRAALQKDGHKIIAAESEGKIIGVLHLTLYPYVIFGDKGSHILLPLVGKTIVGKPSPQSS